MSVDTASPQKLAMLVHHYRQALAPDFGCSPGTSPEWEDLSHHERNCMIAATRLALLDIQGCHLLDTSGDLPPVSGLAGGTEGKECGC